ncbi:MAG: hypothetical protein VB012_00515 [Erysipelotrichaceae bacterium]|nr:hypothetical protein [Erysipelotrichaceae bacterium]
MSFISTVYAVIIAATLIICLLNVLIAAVKKKTWRLMLVFTWLIFVVLSAGITWIYYQGYDFGKYSSFLAEISFLFDGIKADQQLAKIVLGINASILFVGIIYVIILVRSIVEGIKKTAKSTSQYLSERYNTVKNDIKTFFRKKAPEATEENTDAAAADDPDAESKTPETSTDKTAKE